ncbi:MAG: UDP-2,3-diacylglucosamine diphosphatase, partial [Candidatus Eisenbacteria bacterium]
RFARLPRMSAGSAVYFIADAHLGAEPEEREAPRRRRLHEFLTSLRGRASALYIVGDLFDFWFEWRTALPRRHFETLAVLREVRRAGIEVHYLNGNHDFWLGPFLSRELGLVTHDGAVTLETQGHRIWMHHGDGLVGGDLGYRVLKRVVRSRAAVGLYRVLHPDLGWGLAHRVSRWSRHSREDRPPDTDRLWREIAEPRFADGFDTVMVGHFHQVVERRDGPHTLFVLGDWIDFFTAVRLENGVFTLERP